MTKATVKKNKHNIPERKPLSDAAVSARREYYRTYYRLNKDKRKQWTQNHWEKVASQQPERQED